ncbi:peptidase M16 family protein [Tieghemostelium lacteum]|uniref:Peptidase M16 family protein n=1 Tax=Tieghemostelium lacteum TaxID=361077 RepID=A0A151Z4U0_TIELA|nr:peptidase M16 family protein [Tieghemostelium lacteum]|eukprot:KYQ88961.1 peptidase M16 family protein [Tieghemostelium lacteum]
MLSKGKLIYNSAVRFYSTQKVNTTFTSSFQESKRIVESSTLKNGMKVVSLTGGYSGPAVSLGLYIKSGSRNETQETAGIHQFLKNLVFQSNQDKIHLEVQREIESIGSQAYTQASRDSLLISTQSLPTYSKQMLTSLASITNPALPFHEVRDTSSVVQEETEAYQHDITTQLFEKLHQQAFRGKTLGRPLVAPSDNIDNICQQTVTSFVDQIYNPQNFVLVSVGVDHSELVKEADSLHFGRTSTSNANVKINSESAKYIGGESLEYATGNTHVVLGFEGTSHKNTKDLAAFTVLQQLLGVSVPKLAIGNGRSSRLFSLVGNNKDLQQAESFNLTYGDSGLFGLYVETESGDVSKALSLVSSELLAAAKQQSAEELSRAKATARTAALGQADQRSSALEFIGKQALYQQDKILTPLEFAEEISKVTSDDIKRVAKKLLSSKPSLVVVGNISNVPTLEEISSNLKL